MRVEWITRFPILYGWKSLLGLLHDVDLRRYFYPVTDLVDEALLPLTHDLSLIDVVSLDLEFCQDVVHVLLKAVNLDENLLQIQFFLEQLGNGLDLPDLFAIGCCLFHPAQFTAHALEEVDKRVFEAQKDLKLPPEPKLIVLELVVSMELLGHLQVRVEVLKVLQQELTDNQQETGHTGHLRHKVNIGYDLDL